MSAGDGSGREYGRLAFVVGCVLALVLAAALLPAIASSFDQGPLGSVLDPSLQEGGGSTNAQPNMGALNPRQSTTVGGLDGSTSQSLRSLGPEIHFTVQSSQPAYWRTGAYGVYTGSGWEQRGDSRPFSQPLDTPGLTSGTVSYRVELNRSATSLPTVWQPETVSLDRPLEVTGSRALTSEDPLDPGTTYSGTSVRKAREPGVLATAGSDYPASIAERYTALPDSTPDRLQRFTDELTADADSPYETATRIETWLEANKSYSLNVTGPDEGHVATSFVFDMEKGYCEYFATAMTAMLRTQGIPARYVVGYSTGQPTAENTYTVRGMNAHAWVEMYVPDVGWVRFDPTPGRERLNAEQEALERQRPSAPEYDHTESGSPNETFSPDGETQTVIGMDETVTARQPRTPDDPATVTTTVRTPTDTRTPEPVTPTDPATPETEQPSDGESTLNISLSERPVPGTTATVTVTRRDAPVRGATVLFNGESIGRTDATGSVEGTVPYTENLNVTVLPDGGASLAPRAVVPPPDGRQYAVAATNGTNRTRTYRVETNATLSIGGTVATGQSVLVTATVADAPLPDAVVRLDGERVGTTDARGRYRLDLPAEPGNYTLAVERGPVDGERSLDLPTLELSIDSTFPLALPWTDVTVTARLGNETAAGVPVFRGGEQIGTTGPDGSLSTPLPPAGSASFSASRYGQTTTVTVDGLWTNLALTVVPLAVLLGGLAVLMRRRDVDAEAVLDRVAAALSRVVSWLITAADLTLRAGLAALESLRNAAAALGAFLTGRLSAADLQAKLLAWLSDVSATVRAEVASVRGDTHEGPKTTPDRSGAGLTIRESWETFLQAVSIRQPETKTPGELASHAIERDGLPAEAVRTLRDAFRSVEYGAHSPADRLPAVEEAVATIENATRSAEEDGD